VEGRERRRGGGGKQMKVVAPLSQKPYRKKPRTDLVLLGKTLGWGKREKKGQALVNGAFFITHS
jgi:hypothetical protein